MPTPQQGFEYEKNAAKLLKKYELVPKDFTPAGSGSDIPDLMLEYKKIKAGTELKISAASAGSLVIKYNSLNKQKPWGFGNIKKEDKEKLFIQELADFVGLFDLIHQKWKKVPYNREPKDANWKKTVGSLNLNQRYQRDLLMFPEIRGEIPATKIEEYYNRKKTYYVNVGTHGFYLLGAHNPLKLKGVPRFSAAANAKYRARVQYKGGGRYQFTFEMSFSMKTPSEFNIAPVKKGAGVNIFEQNLNLSCFDML